MGIRTIHHQDEELFRYVRSIVELDAQIVVATYDGLLKIPATDLSTVTRDGNQKLLTAFVDLNRNLWFAMEEPGKVYCDRAGIKQHVAADCTLLSSDNDSFWYTSRGDSNYRLNRLRQGYSESWELEPCPTAIAVLDDRVLLGTEHGLYQLKENQLRRFPHPELGHRLIMDLCVDEEDNVWVAAKGPGMAFRIQRDEIHSALSEIPMGNDQITWLLPGVDGHFVVGTFTGLHFFRSGERTQRYAVADGFDGMITHVSRARDGTVWFSTTKGLYTLNRRRVTSYSTTSELEQVYAEAVKEGGRRWDTYRNSMNNVAHDGLMPVPTTLNPRTVRHCVTQDNVTWFTTQRGLFSYEHIRRARPTIVFDRITKGGSLTSNQVRMNTDDEVLRFDYHTVSPVVNESSGMYRYRLQGYSDWQRTKSTFCEYIDLPVGDYTFQVQAIGDDLQTSELLSAAVSVSLPIARYVTTGSLVTTGLAFFGISGWYMVRSRQQKAILEDRVAQGVNKEIELTETLRMAQRLESLGTLAAGVSHDFNNCLQAISISTELALREQDPKTMKDFLGEISVATKQAADLTKSLLTFGRKGSAARKPTRLAKVLTDSVRIVCRTMPAKIQVTTDVSEADEIWSNIDAGLIQQAILNLCINARDAMPTGGTLRIHAFPVLDKRNTVCIRVSDTGCGIPKDQLHRVFEPFFTNKPRGKGTGLGLSTAHGIVTTHEGQLLIESTIDVGTVAEMHLPTCEPVAKLPDQGGMARGKSNELILVADDQAVVRDTVQRVLSISGYRVLKAADGQQALDLARGNFDELAAVFLDVDMPKLDGLQVMRQLRQEGFAKRVVIITGLPDQVRKLTPNSCLLKKPFSADAAIRAIHEDVAATEPRNAV